ncbi:MAG: tRNA(His) guanylyltransferase Thg1 family protein [Lachnospiraceae bacterium]|nr:tRNA(His) guanylyltransferase Thg1 family protein [Lachnospiraceae bacterium]
MSFRDELGTRMKEYYEQIPKMKLMRRTPVMIRVDGKAFHTLTRGFEKPFDEILIKTMQETTKYLCENIQGCVLGYTQSDEISLVLIDYQTFSTAAWFDYEIQKLVSISASMATMAFNRYFERNVKEYFLKNTSELQEKRELEKQNAYKKAMKQGALFDARVFNIPKEEVTNCIYWRQLDASRNSIQMVGQAMFPHKELQGKSCNDIQDMLMAQKGINWNDFPTHQKRGTCVIKEEYDMYIDEKGQEIQSNEADNFKGELIIRTRWKIDKDIPIFKNEGRQYIERLIYVGE